MSQVVSSIDNTTIKNARNFIHALATSINDEWLNNRKAILPKDQRKRFRFAFRDIEETAGYLDAMVKHRDHSGKDFSDIIRGCQFSLLFAATLLTGDEAQARKNLKDNLPQVQEFFSEELALNSTDSRLVEKFSRQQMRR